MSRKMKLALSAIAVGVAGYALLWHAAGWAAAVGVFLIEVSLGSENVLRDKEIIE